MIFKVQRSISTSEDEQQFLIYNEDQSIFEQMNITPELRSLFLRGEYKVYVEGTLDEATGQIQIQDIAEDQAW